jgi:hypothetical protein
VPTGARPSRHCDFSCACVHIRSSSNHGDETHDPEGETGRR